MPVDTALLGLIFSALSTLVVIVGAVIGIRQLRYLRHANELATLTKLVDQYNSPAMHEARAFVRDELPAAMHDPGFLAELARWPHGARARHVIEIANFFEGLAGYILAGALSERSVLIIWDAVILGNWRLLREAVVVARNARGIDVLDYFEDLAMRAEEWDAGPDARAMRARLRRDPRLAAPLRNPPGD